MRRNRGFLSASSIVLCLMGVLVWCFAASAQAHDTVYYYSSDTLHSEVVVTDQDRNVVERTYYASYGQVLNRDLRDGPGYTGHEEDPATGLVYMQQRYYDPQAGRFLSVDPVSVDSTSGGNFNRYEYANDNPYRYTDPDGRCGGPTCDTMVQNYGAWANAHPAEADKLGSTVGVAGVTVMLSATGLSEAAGLVKGAVIVDKALSDTREVSAAGRAANKLRPNTDAGGAHTVFKSDAEGKVTNYATYKENTHNPAGFQVTKRVDVTGKAHTNPDGKVINTPHVKDGSNRYVRPARKDEIPGS